MKIWLPCLFNVFLFCYGIFRVRKETGMPDSPVCFVAVQDQEDVIEYIIRYMIERIRLKALPCRLIVLVGDSQDMTTLIVTKMSRQMSFIVRQINTMEGEKSNFLDLRRRRNITEIHRLLQAFWEWDGAKKLDVTGPAD